MSDVRQHGEEPVDDAQARRPLDWSGLTPLHDAADVRRRLAAASFVVKRSIDEQIHERLTFHFTCPFCGQHEERQDHREAQVTAYSHLLLCEWTDRAGMGPDGAL
jgi:hypothetical protein